jgi:nitrogen fixation NifU-like protein
MASSQYSKEIIKHFRNPRNVGRIEDADGVGKAGNLVCGDLMKLYIEIGENKKGQRIIKDIKFETFGCIVAISNSSLLTTMMKGKTLEEALRLTRDDLIEKLGKPLPPIKLHCSLLAVDALHEAFFDYYSRAKLPIPEELKKDHERIQKALETIEHEHKEFVELEEKLLGEKQ